MKRPVQHETDAAGQRLLRGVFEGLGWVVNAVENDYGADYEIEIFENGASTGATFKVQLKSSSNTHYSADQTFISQPIRVANAKYLTHELRVPTVVVHCDVSSQRTFWLMPQLDPSLSERLLKLADDQSINLNIAVTNELPLTRTAFVEALQRSDAAVSMRAARRVRPTLVAEIGDALGESDSMIKAYQAHSDALRLTQAYRQASSGKLHEAFDLVRQLVAAPASSVEDKFKAWLIWEVTEWNRQIAEGSSDRSRVDTTNRVAVELRTLTENGPVFLRYYAAVFTLAAEVSALAHDGHVLLMAGMVSQSAAFTIASQQLDRRLNRALYRASRVINRLLKTREAWVLPVPLSRLAMSVGIASLTFDQTGRAKTAQSLRSLGLDLCRAAARISLKTEDAASLASVASSALVLSRSDTDEAMALAENLALKITSPEESAFIQRVLDQNRRRNAGEKVEGRIKTTPRQIIENIKDGLQLGRVSQDKDK